MAWCDDHMSAGLVAWQLRLVGVWRALTGLCSACVVQSCDACRGACSRGGRRLQGQAPKALGAAVSLLAAWRVGCLVTRSAVAAPPHWAIPAVSFLERPFIWILHA